MDAELATRISARTVPLPLRLLGDERLARLVGSGHEEAFSILYQRHHQTLYRYCRSLVGTDADAQDALQSAMTGALVALRIGRRDAPIRPWLFRIVHNESMTQLRRRRPVVELGEELPALDGCPERAVEQRNRLSRLLADMRELPERQRGALVMRELSGLSHQEVAEALGVSVGAAKQMVFEARRSLQEFDEGRAMACEHVRHLISDGDGRSLRGRRVRAHIRDCGGCAAFAAAIPQRRADLQAFAPVLPAGAAAGLLFRVTGAGSGHGTGGSAGLLSTATGKAVVAGASSKLLATGALIVATAAVGTTGVLHAISQSGSSARAGSAVTPSSATGSHRVVVTSHHKAGVLGSAKLTAAERRAAHRAAAARARAHHGRSGLAGDTTHGSAAATHSHGSGAKGKGVAKSAAGTGGRHLGTQTGTNHGTSSAGKPSHPTTSQAPLKPVTSGGPQTQTLGKGGSGSHSGQSASSGTGGAGAAGLAHGTAGKTASAVVAPAAP